MQTADQARKPRSINRRKAPADRRAEQLSLVTQAAKEAVTTLARLGLPCALFGSLACLLYGNSRNPKDADILVLPPPNDTRLAEEIKSQIVALRPTSFYLKSARDPTAPYKILYYRLHSNGPTCKVDILTPYIMHLPALLPTQILWSAPENIPVCPFALLLLHKLQAWDDHIKATEHHKFVKHQQDAADVRRMLEITIQVDKLAALGAFPWGKMGNALFSEEFQSLSEERVVAYCAAFPARAGEWKRIGFKTEKRIDDDIPVLRVGLASFTLR